MCNDRHSIAEILLQVGLKNHCPNSYFFYLKGSLQICNKSPHLRKEYLMNIFMCSSITEFDLFTNISRNQQKSTFWQYITNRNICVLCQHGISALFSKYNVLFYQWCLLCQISDVLGGELSVISIICRVKRWLHDGHTDVHGRIFELPYLRSELYKDSRFFLSCNYPQTTTTNREIFLLGDIVNCLYNEQHSVQTQGSHSVLGSSWSWSYGRWIYNYLCNQCISLLMLWVRIPLRRGVLDTLCDKVCQWFAEGRWCSPDTLVFSNNKTDRHDIIKIVLKVALNTILLTLIPSLFRMRYVLESSNSTIYELFFVWVVLLRGHRRFCFHLLVVPSRRNETWRDFVDSSIHIFRSWKFFNWL